MGLPEHYRAVNQESGHASNCGWGAGADCNCGKHTCSGCGCCGDCFCDLKSEAANQAGMAHGVQASNEVKGCADSGPPDCPVCLKPRAAGHHGCACDYGCDWCGDSGDLGPGVEGDNLCLACREKEKDELEREAELEAMGDHDDACRSGDFNDYDDSYRPRGGADLWWDPESGEPRCG